VLTSLRVYLWRLLELVSARRREARLAEEVQAHLDLLTERYAAKGVPLPEARLAAAREFGGVAPMVETYRDQRGLPVLDAIRLDLRFAARLLARDRAFAVTVVLVLGLGIGVNNMLFTILYAHTMRGLPLREADRIASIASLDDTGAVRGVSRPDFDDLARSTRGFDRLAAYTSAPVTLGDEGRAPDRVDATWLTAGALELLETRPLRGRSIAATDDRPEAPAVAMLSRATWQSRYGGDAAIVGRAVLVNGVPTVIVGILPDRPPFPSTAQVWLPLAQRPGPTTLARDARDLSVVGRLRDGVAFTAALAEIEAIVATLERAHPATNRKVRARVTPINERFFGSPTNPVWLAFISVGVLVALISCANVANLLLARAIHRTREMAIRLSLGASRRRVVRQLLFEALLLAICGGATGLAVATAGVRGFKSLIPENVLPYWFDYSLDLRIAIVLVAVSLGTVIVFGLVPALHASKADVNHVLKETTTRHLTHGARRWTTVFLTGELALAVLMLANLAHGLRISAPPLAAEVAIDTPDILTAGVSFSDEGSGAGERRAEVLRLLIERLSAMPSIAGASFASALPLQGADSRRLAIDGQGGTIEQDSPSVGLVTIGPRYFSTLGLTMTRGREMARQGASAAQEVVVNDRFVAVHFGAADPIGRRIALAAPGSPVGTSDWRTIVGVAPDLRQTGRGGAAPLAYVSYGATIPPTMSLVVRTALDTGAASSLVRAEMAALDATAPLSRIRSMKTVLADTQWNGRVASLLLNVLAGIALMLTTVGLYAVTTHAVSQRAHEIALRLALGARRGHVMLMVLRRLAWQLLLGFGAGVGCVAAWVRVFPSGRADVTVSDPVSLGAAALGLALIAAVAAVAPLRRATRVDPLVTLRT
jgi:putative ABC transport system permease protein